MSTWVSVKVDNGHDSEEILLWPAGGRVDRDDPVLDVMLGEVRALIVELSEGFEEDE